MVVIAFLVLIFLSLFIAGTILLYSAFTGKMISQPESDSTFTNKMFYTLRGFLGCVAILMSFVVIYILLI